MSKFMSRSLVVFGSVLVASGYSVYNDAIFDARRLGGFHYSYGSPPPDSIRGSATATLGNKQCVDQDEGPDDRMCMSQIAQNCTAGYEYWVVTSTIGFPSGTSADSEWVLCDYIE